MSKDAREFLEEIARDVLDVIDEGRAAILEHADALTDGELLKAVLEV